MAARDETDEAIQLTARNAKWMSEDWAPGPPTVPADRITDMLNVAYACFEGPYQQYRTENALLRRYWEHGTAVLAAYASSFFGSSSAPSFTDFERYMASVTAEWDSILAASPESTESEKAPLQTLLEPAGVEVIESLRTVVKRLSALSPAEVTASYTDPDPTFVPSRVEGLIPAPEPTTADAAYTTVAPPAPPSGPASVAAPSASASLPIAGVRIPLPDKVHEYLTACYETVARNPLWRDDPALVATLCRCIEKAVFIRLHDTLFGSSPLSAWRDEWLCAKLRRFASIAFEDMVDTMTMPEWTAPLWRLAGKALDRMNDHRSPHDKLQCVQNACQIVSTTLTFVLAKRGERPEVGADLFLPSLFYLVLRYPPRQLYANCKYMGLFLSPSVMNSQSGFLLTNIESAVHIALNMQPPTPTPAAAAVAAPPSPTPAVVPATTRTMGAETASGNGRQAAAEGQGGKGEGERGGDTGANAGPNTVATPSAAAPAPAAANSLVAPCAVAPTGSAADKSAAADASLISPTTLPAGTSTSSSSSAAAAAPALVQKEAPTDTTTDAVDACRTCEVGPASWPFKRPGGSPSVTGTGTSELVVDVMTVAADAMALADSLLANRTSTSDADSAATGGSPGDSNSAGTMFTMYTTSRPVVSGYELQRVESLQQSYGDAASRLERIIGALLGSAFVAVSAHR